MQRQPHRLRHVEQEFVGRQAALSALSALLEPDGPGVTHIYGIAGIGKSRLLAVFAEHARSGGGNHRPARLSHRGTHHRGISR